MLKSTPLFKRTPFSLYVSAGISYQLDISRAKKLCSALLLGKF